MSSKYPAPPFPEQPQDRVPGRTRPMDPKPEPRVARRVELAPVYVMLASDESSYVSGATVAVTGGKPVI